METTFKAIPWEKVYIFISSTFNDMHAERDYLVKRVFPELQDWCERRKLSFRVELCCDSEAIRGDLPG